MATANKKPTAAQKAAKYATLRQKAIDRGATNGKPTVVTNEPYVLGAEYGFEPEISIPVPNLETLIVFQNAAEGNNVWEITRSIMGPSNAVRIIRALDENFEVDEAEQVMSGILLDMLDHFFGPGAGEVRGGFTL